jgi:hypothetical protein
MPSARTLTLAILVAAGAPAEAQPTDNKVLAEQLFEQARALAKADQWAEACPKFEASLRYDATLGTRLNLATCYEKVGKLASAWAQFREAAERARLASDTARRDYANKQAAALLPRLPKLTIAGPATPPEGFAVTRDGVVLELAALGSALYVDPGFHEVAASAPGFEPFKAAVRIEEAQAKSVVIRELVAIKRPATPEPPPEAPAVAAEDEDDERPSTPADPARTRRWIGLGVGGGGVLLAGIGLVVGAAARSTYHDAKSLCGPELVCDDEAELARGRDLISRARTRATLSTVFVVTGAAAAVAGAVVWFTAPRRERRERRVTGVVPVVTDRDVGVAVVGRF